MTNKLTELESLAKEIAGKYPNDLDEAIGYAWQQKIPQSQIERLIALIRIFWRPVYKKPIMVDIEEKPTNKKKEFPGPR